MYNPHPSAALNRLFAQRPFQGAEPESAEFVFVGLDANYDASIERTACFEHVIDYHADGVAFWRRHGVHHPFLLAGYRGDGRRYHLNFSKIGFKPDDAHRVAFVELLHCPTAGRSALSADDLSAEHLQRLNNLVVRAGSHRHVFLSAGVARLMEESGRFPWLRRRPPSGETLPLLFQSQHCTVHLHLHFSNYGKFQAQLDNQSRAIAQLAGRQSG